MIPERDPEGNETSNLHRLVNFTDQRVLEIGCGDGRLTRRYAASTRHVAAIDLDAARLATALEYPVPSSPRITFAQAQAEALPFRAESFDIAILAWSL